MMIVPMLAQEPAAASNKAAFRVIVNFDSRHTFVNDDPIRFYGFRVGAQRGNDVLAIGFYGIGDSYIQQDVLIPGVGSRTLHTDFDYTALTYERLFINSKRWQVGVPISLGLGNYRRGFINEDKKLVPWTINELVPIEATVHADYNLFWWMFIGTGAGYRYVFAEREASRTLSDRTYYIKLGVRVGELAKRAFAKKKDDGTK
ncbi:MAG TPA: hypothetical protein PK760_05640 [Flavobacteriales bacterium]|nr:hypothetical protein [Flavobacteriales bacterium]